MGAPSRGFVHHIDLTVRDLARPARFYGDVLPLLGFARSLDAPEGPIWAGEDLLAALGVTILDPPADYPQYADGYDALFFADPDGLKLEYVHTPVWPVAPARDGGA